MVLIGLSGMQSEPADGLLCREVAELLRAGRTAVAALPHWQIVCRDIWLHDQHTADGKHPAAALPAERNHLASSCRLVTSWPAMPTSRQSEARSVSARCRV
jgi:hypothetical protein